MIVTTQNHSVFKVWAQLIGLLGVTAASLAGCGSAGTPCPTDHCLSLSLTAPGSVRVTNAEVIVRDGDMVSRHTLWGATLTTVLQVPSAFEDETHRRAVYVRATADSATGRVALRGSVVGAEAWSSVVRVELLPDCDGAACETPSARFGAAVVYDPLGRSVLLHGGVGATGVPLADLWAWNGLHWKRLMTDSGPQPRWGHVMASDPLSGQVLVGFGQDQRDVFDDTWLLNPQTHSWQRMPVQSPGARRRAAVGTTLTGGHRNLVLFGGQTATGEALGDTWLWDGSDWQAGPSSVCAANPLVPSSLPRCRQGAALVESRRFGTLLLGGTLGPQPSSDPMFDDRIWHFVDGSWSVAPLPSPAFVLSRAEHGAALLLRNGQPQGAWVGLGDSAVGLRQDGYILTEDGSQFQPVLGDAPTPRRQAAVAFDAEREELVIFGGEGSAGPLSDTITFSAETGYRSQR